METSVHPGPGSDFDFSYVETDEDVALFLKNARPLVQEAIDDAVQRVRTLAFPYFETIAKERGYGSDWDRLVRGLEVDKGSRGQ